MRNQEIKHTEFLTELQKLDGRFDLNKALKELPATFDKAYYEKKAAIYEIWARHLRKKAQNPIRKLFLGKSIEKNIQQCEEEAKCARVFAKTCS